MNVCFEIRTLPLAVLFAALLFADLAVPLTAQIEEEDLPPESFTQLTYERYSLEELREQLAQAETVFLNAEDPVAAVAPFTRLVEVLDERLANELAEDPEAERALLVEVLSLRARANFNLGDDDAVVDNDLRRLLATEPGHDLNPTLVSPKLLDRFKALQGEMVGEVEVTVFPDDAEVLVDGQPILVRAEAAAVLAGQRQLVVKRAGFTSVEQALEIRAGRKETLDFTLERDSAVLVVVTRPIGAEVRIDDQAVGQTSGSLPSGYGLRGDATRFPREEFSEPMRIGGLLPGPHRLEILLDGYRPYRVQMEIPELLDYETGAVVLERTEGVVVLRDLPAGAEVAVNGQPVTVRGRGAEAGRLRLPPGSYRVGVRHGTDGVFEASFDLADAQTKEIPVRLRPGLALLGVLGGDDVAAAKLRGAIAEASAGLDGWAFLDRTDVGPRLLEQAGVAVQSLRDAGNLDRRKGPGVDWQRVQGFVDRQAPGAVYVLAVLSDDLLASHADLWMWPAAPAPARPDRQRVELADSGEIQRLVEAFGRPLNVRRPWLGAQLIDSLAASGPVVIDLDPNGPAARAGMRVGDELRSIFNNSVDSVAAVQEALGVLRPESSVSVTLANAAGQRTVDVQLGSSPAVVPLNDPDRIYAAVSASLTSARRDLGQDIPGWLLELNQAAVFLQGSAWEDAVRALRRIQKAPQGPGLGQAAVDYWLAIALKAAGPSYIPQAREALERAASAPGARLFHHDGPLVAPRARARLYSLGQ